MESEAPWGISHGLLGTQSIVIMQLCHYTNDFVKFVKC